jgi:hypothetical protein
MEGRTVGGTVLRRSVITAVAGLALLLAPGTASAGTAAITGTVSAADSEAPLANVRVAAGKSGEKPTFETRTAADGTYSIGGLDPGSYDLLFDPPDGVNYAPEWYYEEPDQSLSDPITLSDGQTAAGTDADLSPGGTLSGHVTDSAGAAAAMVCVGAFSFDRNTGTIRSAGSAATDASGGYSIDRLQSGFYKLWFGPVDGSRGKCAGGARGTGFAEQWLGGQPDFFSAEPVRVTAGEERAGLDARLDRTAGTNAAPTSTAPAAPGPGACVVPKVKGVKAAAARKAIRRAHCKPGKETRRAHVKVKRGRAIGTKPKAGTSLPAGTAVELVISSGRAR